MGFIDLISMMGPLFLMIILLAGALYFVKKHMVPKSLQQRGGLNVKIISTTPIAPKKYISVVKLKDKLLVLGVSDNSVNLLKELDSDDETTFNEQLPSGNNDFMSLIKGYFIKQ